MKKLITLSLLFIAIVPFTVGAQTGTLNGGNPGANTGTLNGGNPGSVATLTNPLKVNSLGDLVKSGIQVFSYIAVLVGVLMFVVVGLQYILARGNPQKMKDASKWLLGIVIGVAIVIGANVAITIVISTLSATGVVDPNVIQSAQNAIK